MERILVQGWASVPERFWNIIKIDPEKDPEGYKTLLDNGYIDRTEKYGDTE